MALINPNAAAVATGRFAECHRGQGQCTAAATAVAATAATTILLRVLPMLVIHSTGT